MHVTSNVDFLETKSRNTKIRFRFAQMELKWLIKELNEEKELI